MSGQQWSSKGHSLWQAVEPRVVGSSPWERTRQMYAVASHAGAAHGETHVQLPRDAARHGAAARAAERAAAGRAADDCFPAGQLAQAALPLR